MVFAQNIRGLSLQKSQTLAIKTRFYLFQNCYIFFFSHEKNKCEAVARYSDGGVGGTAICSFLFSWLGLCFLCWLLDLSWSQLRALNQQKIHTAKTKQNKTKKGVLYRFSPSNWLILMEGNEDMGLRMRRGWRRSFWQRWAMKLAQLCCAPELCTPNPPKWCMSSSLQLSLHVINLTLALLI